MEFPRSSSPRFVIHTLAIHVGFSRWSDVQKFWGQCKNFSRVFTVTNPLSLLVTDRIMKTTTSGRNNGIQWTLLTQLGKVDFTNDLTLFSQNPSQMQEKWKNFTLQPHQQEWNLNKITPLSNNQSQLVESPSKNWNPLFTSRVWWTERVAQTWREIKKRQGNSCVYHTIEHLGIKGHPNYY